ncbi:MAG: DUF4363 family protein [Bacillota bacterium]
MKINIFVSLLLIFIIIASLYSHNFINKEVEKIENNLKEIKIIVEEKDWQKVNISKKNLIKNWKKTQENLSIFIDHEAIHDLDLSISQLRLYLEEQNEKKVFEELNLSLTLLADIKKREKITFSNVF